MASETPLRARSARPRREQALRHRPQPPHLGRRPHLPITLDVTNPGSIQAVVEAAASRRQPADYFRSVGLHGSFWGLADHDVERHEESLQQQRVLAANV